MNRPGPVPHPGSARHRQGLGFLAALAILPTPCGDRTGAARVADYLSFVRTVVTQVHDRLVKGELQRDVKDGLAAAKQLAALEPPQDAVGQLEHWIEALQIHMQEMAEIMTPQQLDEFTRRVSAYPLMRELKEANGNGWHDNDDPDDLVGDCPRSVQGHNVG